MELSKICWIGIDPGATGAMAVIHEDGRVEIMDFPADECALASELEGLDGNLSPERVVIEQQQAMPKQGVVSVFKLGVNYGVWLAAVAMMQWPYQTMRPADWKRGMGYPKDKKESKAHSLTLARRLYPQASDMLSRVKDHNRAEALLLAHIAKEGEIGKTATVRSQIENTKSVIDARPSDDMDFLD